MRASVLVGVAVASLALSGCESGGSGASPQSTADMPLIPIAAPTPVPSPSPSPTPSPTPTPTPPPAPANTSGYPNPADDGITVVVAEGDSISVDYGGYYAGYYKSRHPELTFRVLAVGGSGIGNMVARIEAVQLLNPDIVTVFIGANDLGAATSAQAYFDRLMAYVAPLRARGTKVLVATNLPIMVSANMNYTNNHNNLREPVAVLLKAAVGRQIDGVIDFGGDPVMGQVTAPSNRQLYSDGVHPTDRNWQGARGGHDYLYDIYEAALQKILAP